jgi:hypothetical protein
LDCKSIGTIIIIIIIIIKTIKSVTQGIRDNENKVTTIY